jgi:miniconductance mechanosensitive channel
MLEDFLSLHPLMPAALGLAVLAGTAFFANVIVKRVLLRIVRRLVSRGIVGWGEVLVEYKVFGRLAEVVPGLIVYSGINLVPGVADWAVTLTRNVAMAYVVLMLTLTVTALLSAGDAIYSRKPIARERPIRGFVQLAQIVIYVVGGILIVALLIDRSPLILLSSFGAMTAVVLLVFRDTILGFVASVQLSGLDMVRVGDWIEMPQYGADGDVVEVALHTVRVQNWDKTITTIPTHKLIAESFRNWRGMSESGGRRIKRAIRLDLSTIRFLSDDEIVKLKRFAVLRSYIDAKQAELDDYHASLGDDWRTDVNRRRLTNAGTFRAYVRGYLQSHPAINHGMTLLVRQLSPGAEGLPIEIYCFTRSTEWAVYEDVQSDIFDHVIAILPEFGLRLFQNPTGADLSNLATGRAVRAAAGPEPPKPRPAD